VCESAVLVVRKSLPASFSFVVHPSVCPFLRWSTSRCCCFNFASLACRHRRSTSPLLIVTSRSRLLLLLLLQCTANAAAPPPLVCVNKRHSHDEGKQWRRRRRIATRKSEGNLLYANCCFHELMGRHACDW